MAKLEEIAELLVSEIRDFEVAVKKLEEIQKAKISINLTELKSVLSKHEIQLKKQSSALQETYNRFADLMKEAKIYTKWAVIVLIVSLLINLGLITLFVKRGLV